MSLGVFFVHFVVGLCDTDTSRLNIIRNKTNKSLERKTGIQADTLLDRK